MDFSLTDEQEMLRATARQFVADVCPPERAKEWDEESAAAPGAVQGHGRAGLVLAALRRSTTAGTAAARWS